MQSLYDYRTKIFLFGITNKFNILTCTICIPNRVNWYTNLFYRNDRKYFLSERRYFEKKRISLHRIYTRGIPALIEMTVIPQMHRRVHPKNIFSRNNVFVLLT